MDQARFDFLPGAGLRKRTSLQGLAHAAVFRSAKTVSPARK
jgi:hypothetical protein